MVEALAALSGVALRTATVDDIDTVIALWSVAAEDAHRPPDSPEALHRLLGRDADALLLAERDDAVVGSLIAGWDGWRFHLYRLAVHPDHRRGGIGGLLLDRAEERFAGFGARRVDAMVLDDNPLAHSFWSRRGYRPQSEWSRWVAPLGG